MRIENLDAYTEKLIDVLKRTEISKGDIKYNYEDGIKLLVDIFTEKKKAGSKVYFIGNGGSAAIASHMTADFMKNGGMNTVSLYDNAVTTCMGNDYGYEHVFSKPLSFLAGKGDLLVAISSSGKSQNIINSIDVAMEKGMSIISFTGFSDDNPARRISDVSVYIPSHKYGIVESIHNLILQEIVDLIMECDGVSL
ncbi:MAG: SIS domain-containing protein [Lachnospiraceae bacterium]|nr:SIS domain-containing protein [Lachnospiraceae bacterium]